jgi:ParB-like chromosome segregation protein Spo0J
MKIEHVPISQIKKNPDNPRVIKDEDFRKLVKSIKEFPEMLEIRTIVVNKDWVVLGGNRRFEACKAAGLKQVPVIHAKDLTEEQQRRFIVADNVSAGSWDFDMLQSWDKQELSEWGLDVPTLDEEKEKIEPEETEIRPYTRTHILISFPPDRLIDIQEQLEKLLANDFIEYEQASN